MKEKRSKDKHKKKSKHKDKRERKRHSVSNKINCLQPFYCTLSCSCNIRNMYIFSHRVPVVLKMNGWRRSQYRSKAIKNVKTGWQ